MKKILMSLVAIVGVAAIAGGVTYSYFTDSETNEDNVFKTGTLDIILDDDGVYPYSNSTPIFADANVGNMYPGYTAEPEYTFVANPGTLPFNWTFSVNQTADTPGTGGGNLYNVLKVKVEVANGNPYNYPADGSFNCETVSAGWTEVDDLFVADGTYPDKMGQLDAGKGMCYRFTPYLEGNLVNVNGVDVDDNNFMAASATYELVVDAYQTNDPAYDAL